MTLLDFIFRRNHNQEVSERHVVANNNEANKHYCNNHIKTSKYNLLTFLPINLFEQFQKSANLYFLIQIIIMSIPKITALAPSSTAIPLTLVLLATMVKDGYDDYGRHTSDSTINSKDTQVLKDNEWKKTKWRDVQAGDIVRVDDNEPVASDILVLSTKNPSGLCFIETADLDGETNLKVRQPLAETCESLNNKKALRDFDGEVRCEPPNNRLEKFNGNLEWNGKTYSLDNNNIVLRGCIMRNTPSVVGVVLYAGHDSKIMMNSGKNMFKKTKLDKMTNQMVIYIAGLLALICTFCSIMSYVFERDTGKKFQVYLPWDTFYQDSPGLIAVINWPGFVMVLNTLIPISLYISVEVIRLGQSLLINWDVQLYDEESKTPAYARNTTLTEELGQIQYIFSDKTGTLTQNVMEFKECSINGKIYGHTQDKNNDDNNDDMKLEDCQSVDSKECVNLTAENKYADSNFKFYDHDLKSLIDSKTEECLKFFRNLAVCHTVMVEDKEKITRSLPDLTDDQGYDTADFVPMQPKDSKAECVIEYQAQSPDEGALVSAARNFGFVFKSRTPNSITIETTLGEEIYDLLCILDFDNVRKRMSVIVRRDDKIMLYCKGADTALYELLSSESKPIMASTSEHLDAFATEGLRTLVLASRELTQQEYHNWSQMYKEASTAMENRDEKVAEAFEFIERDLTLQGATAIEDKLQDGVPETIFNLAEANIKIWVLTGDKQETAINIGYSSMLLTEDMRDVFIIDGGSTEEVQQQITQATNSTHNANNGTTTPDPNGVKVIGVTNFDGGSIELTQNGSCGKKEGFALVISGKSLAFALLPEVELSFLELAKSCKAVICCRVTPLQKALVVELVKRNVKATTLAIGDGANDVSMIKAAHIGVGISGKEGRQAVLSSDYSFGQFRFLERLLLVHGRWSYWRMAKFLGYFFYKNFAFTLVQFWYTFFSGFTAQTLYDAMFLSVYNVCFTSLPVLAMGIFDQDVSAENSLRHPRMYIPGQSNLLFNKRQFFLKLVHGILTSLVLFFIAYGVLYDRVNSAGEPESVYDIFSVAVGGILVVVVNLQMALDTSHWTWINHFFIWGSIVFYFLFTFFTTSSFLYASFPALFPQVSAGEKTFTSGVFWAAMLITCVVCILPVIGYRWCMQKMRPSLAEYVRRGLWKQKRSTSSLLFGRRRSQRSVRRRPESSRSAFAFSQVSGFGEMIMSGKWLPRFGTRGTFDVTSHQPTAS